MNEIASEWIPAAAAGIYLIPCTVMDIRDQNISLKAVLAGISGAFVWMILELVYRKLTWVDLIVSVIPGLLLMFLSVLGRGSIGTGDGIIILVLGLLMGCRTTMVILLTGLFLSAGWSVVLLIRKKAGRSSRIPMIPFILTGYCLWGGVSVWEHLLKK